MGIELNLQKQINGFSLDVEWESGDGLTALFGFSGSGKTMTLRMIAGLMEPDTGYVSLNKKTFFDSRSRTNVKTRFRRVGYVFQDYALMSHMTVEQNITYGLRGSPAGEKKERVREMIGDFSLKGLEKSFPREISGGEKQRVALARALIARPALLMLDEPFSTLDRPVRLQTQGIIAKVRSAFGIPVILVTHDFSEVRSLADEVIIYSGGRVAQTGSPDYIGNNPANSDVKSLVGIE